MLGVRVRVTVTVTVRASPNPKPKPKPNPNPKPKPKLNSNPNLDSEQRLLAARVLKRFVQTTGKTAFVVEHDMMMATYLADRVVVYDGQPAVSAVATSPQPLLKGMNAFLKTLDVSFRRDPETHRPRINKPGSVADKEQKASGDYFYVE